MVHSSNLTHSSCVSHFSFCAFCFYLCHFQFEFLRSTIKGFLLHFQIFLFMSSKVLSTTFNFFFHFWFAPSNVSKAALLLWYHSVVMGWCVNVCIDIVWKSCVQHWFLFLVVRCKKRRLTNNLVFFSPWCCWN